MLSNRFCVAVKREGYPEDVPLPDGVPTKGLSVIPQPAHTITIMCPVVLVNLLPCDLSYQVKNTPAKGNIKAGKSVPLYTVRVNLLAHPCSFLGCSSVPNFSS